MNYGTFGIIRFNLGWDINNGAEWRIVNVSFNSSTFLGFRTHRYVLFKNLLLSSRTLPH